MVKYFVKNKLDSLITVENKQVHAFFDDSPINYNINGEFSKTQDLKPVQLFVYSIMMWRASTFVDEYKENGHALFCGKFDTFTVNSLSGMIIKTQHDLMLADLIMHGINKNQTNYQVQYHSLYSKIMIDKGN